MKARHAEFPAASNARTVTVVLPTRSGTAADHLVVPDAVPASPFEVDQATRITPTLSLAVPLTAMAADEVATIVSEGTRICKDGGVVSPLPVGGVGAGCAG